MSPRNPDRELREARAAYVGAVTRFRKALAAFDDSGMPMDPGPDPVEPYPWTPEQWAIVRELLLATGEMADYRREWDRLRRGRRAER